MYSIERQGLTRRFESCSRTPLDFSTSKEDPSLGSGFRLQALAPLTPAKRLKLSKSPLALHTVADAARFRRPGKKATLTPSPHQQPITQWDCGPQGHRSRGDVTRKVQCGWKKVAEKSATRVPRPRGGSKNKRLGGTTERGCGKSRLCYWKGSQGLKPESYFHMLRHG